MLVLASASPRRRELLAQAGYFFTVHPAHIPEDPLPNEDPIAHVTRLAREKAQAVFAELSCKSPVAPGPGSPRTGLRPWGGGPSHLGTWESTNPNLQSTTSLTVLAADTIVTLDNQILGKPVDAADAARMLRLLSGRTHHVITGVALVSATSTRVASESTAVTFRVLSGEEIAGYIATGEPMDKAGAYAIQGRAARWIPRIEGDYFNVVGLPIALVSSLLDSL
ncbi:MAG: Maf family protein [Terracidiphilus sp.]